MELEVSCATEGSSLSYIIDGVDGTVEGNPGRVKIERGCTLVLTASKDGYESSTRTINITIPIKMEVKAGIESISADAAGEARYYDLQGRPVAKPATGLYIKVENGKASKVAL